ncbi:urease accessory protein UreE [Ectothiorhodospiraceae bacterium BW-2]|nr:urease accessory protein UreE [Ectothiorhodospiraceae bacterium BW-2]
MLKLTHRLRERRAAQTTLTLPLEQRVKGRLRVILDDGRDAGLFLERGPVLRGGDQIASDEGVVVEICAAAETVSTVRGEDALQLARACYHLGNRHVALQIGDGWLRYRHDHVLDQLVVGLGLTVICEQAPFEPESGAYGEQGLGHSHEPHH